MSEAGEQRRERRPIRRRALVGSADGGSSALPQERRWPRFSVRGRCRRRCVSASAADEASASSVRCTPKPVSARKPGGSLKSYRFVTVLVFHHVADAQRFAADLDQLRAWGYVTVSPDDVTRFLSSHDASGLPAKPLLLTFDDGGLSQYEQAFPQLHARGMTATFYVVPDWIDDLMSSSVFLEPHHFTWANAQEMHSAGMRIQAHGKRHVDSRTLGGDGSGAGADFLATKARIETRVVGETVNHLAYPYGLTNSRAISSLKSVGCRSARLVRVNLDGTYPGPNQGLLAYCAGFADPFAMPCAGAGDAAYVQQLNAFGVLGPDSELCRGSRVSNWGESAGTWRRAAFR